MDKEKIVDKANQIIDDARDIKQEVDYVAPKIARTSGDPVVFLSD